MCRPIKSTVICSRHTLPFAIALLFLTATGCAGPSKLYSGEAKPSADVATIVARLGRALFVDGRWIINREVAVLPGHHRVVATTGCAHVFGRSAGDSQGAQGSCSQIDAVGFVELDARAGHSYSAGVGLDDRSKVYSWAVDLDTCEVVAGATPIAPAAMSDEELQCVDKPVRFENVLRATVGVAAAVATIAVTNGQGLPPPEPPEDASSLCNAKPCGFGPELSDQESARLMVPTCPRWSGRYACVGNVSFPDGLSAWRTANVIRMEPGMRTLIFQGIASTSFWSMKHLTIGDGIVMDVKADRVYALCIAYNEHDKSIARWIVDNDTGRVAFGTKTSFAMDYGASHSPYCPVF